ncbi:MAG: CPBP family intramembrane metalloprotease [Myxococcales bacterium]|nr:CPBP family intramembrane metalloprotease [Myxococcales bacterium]
MASASLVRRGYAHVVAAFDAIDAERAPLPANGPSERVVVATVLLVATLGMLLQEYVGARRFFVRHFSSYQDAAGAYWELWQFCWWGLWRVVGYIVLPCAAIWWVLRQRVRDFHLGLGELPKHAWLYGIMLLAVLPVVWLASQAPAFRDTYPFYSLAHRSAFDFIAWQLIYGAQFIGVEFFFRGWLLHGLRPMFGAHAIFIAVVPYCMIHFPKPMPEAIGSVIAGLVLGTMALRSKSIWGGVVLHIAVAVAMDALAIMARR